MFTGEHRHNLDAKNRLFIPAKFREELEEVFVIAKPLRGNCLRICSEKEWEKYMEPIYEMPDEENLAIIRKLHRQALQVSPDAQGRVVLTNELLATVGIQKSVVIIGCGRYIEIFSEEGYNAMIDEEDTSNMLQKLSKVKR